MFKFILFVISFLLSHGISTGKSFEMLFQSSSYWSANEMAEFKGPIPTLTEFTICHWEKLAYLSERNSNIWSYCYQNGKEQAKMNCIQVYSMGDQASYNRNIVYALWIDTKELKKDIQFKVSRFGHRQWNHVCIIYSTLTSSSSIYFNGVFIETQKQDYLPIIPGTENVKESAFILAQEPDSMRGDFSADQAFYGSISELNMWNVSLKEELIQDMATARSFMKGNVVYWRKENFKTENIVIKDIQDEKSVFLNKRKSYVIFPKKLLKNEAESTCLAQGGSMVVPGSKIETSEATKVLLKHSEACKSENEVTECWLGLSKPESNWIRIRDQVKVENNTYTNWKHDRWKANFSNMCSWMNKDGTWKADTKESCNRMRLCTICEFPTNPVFSIKGLCYKDTGLQWNYYPVVNDSYQIHSYEGYKRHQSISLHKNEWKSEYNGDSFIIRNVDNPVGRMEWEWFEKSCTKEKQKRNLTFSHCEFSSNFTCDSGHCVPIRKRCDGVMDCTDGSDEDACINIDVPRGYDKLKPPKSNTTDDFHVRTRITIININQIDLEKMMLDSSLKVTMEWTDSRLMFKNLPHTGQAKRIRPAISNKLWLPVENLDYQNAIVGEVEVDPSIQISLNTSSDPLPSNINRHREELIYKGTTTSIQLTKTVRLKTTCDFQFKKFPFDEHKCTIQLGMKVLGNEKVDLVGTNHSIEYIGGDTVGQFDIACPPYMHTNHIPRNGSSHLAITITIPLNRRPINGIIQIIIPSLVLWLCAFLTLQYDVVDLTNRNRTSVTVLLALVTLYGSITMKVDFPKTSGFKAIDVWFVWYLINIFVMICHHTVIGRLATERRSNTICPKKNSFCMCETEEDTLAFDESLHRKETINSIMNLILLLSMLSFNVFYFLLSNYL